MKGDSPRPPSSLSPSIQKVEKARKFLGHVSYPSALCHATSHLTSPGVTSLAQALTDRRRDTISVPLLAHPQDEVSSLLRTRKCLQWSNLQTSTSSWAAVLRDGSSCLRLSPVAVLTASLCSLVPITPGPAAGRAEAQNVSHLSSHLGDTLLRHPTPQWWWLTCPWRPQGGAPS